uniref:Sorting nexin n=2 Tax=Clytia hemisphaerica TaxID=252671 RepID=A0A7M5X746_9CNID
NHRYVFIVFSIWAFAIGVGLALLLLRNCHELPNLLLLLQITGSIKTPKTTYEVKMPKRKGCTVCSKKGCSRHRPEVSNQMLRPWESVQIPKPVDDALSEFLEMTLRTHLYSWYWDLSHDQRFVDEIRDMLRYASAVLVERLQKINLTDFVLKKVTKKIVIHFDCYLRVKEAANYGTDIQSATLEKLKTYKHFAVQNELAEESYMRYTVETILPYLLPKNALVSNSCNFFLEELLSRVILQPLAEKIAEPDMVNNLLLIFLDEETIPEPNYPPSAKTEILSQFGRHRGCQTTSALKVSSYDLMHNATFLYPFMQYMKREGSLNILQFCLAVEEFNKRSLAPELSENEEEQVLEEAREIDALYFRDDAVDKINFPNSVVNEFQKAVADSVDRKGRLETATPLFQAYEFAVDLLDKTYVPMFHQSEEFYSLLCGDKSPKKKRAAEINLAKRKFMGFENFSKLASKIKAKKQERDFGEQFSFDDNDSPAEEAFESEEEYELDDDDADEDEVLDLSYWHITIPKVDFIFDKNKKLYVFILQVERLKQDTRLDASETSWQVVRKYNEFYVLHDKLKRFHDSFSVAELPTKRTILRKDFDYMNSARSRFQEYLQRLVRSPILRTSGLLHSFLTPGQEMDKLFEPDSVGREAHRKVNSLKSKLVVEKGQNLDSFLDCFIQSAEPPLKKKMAAKSPPSMPTKHRRSDSRMYLPPPAWAIDHRRNMSSSSDESTHTLPHYQSVTQLILFIARHFFRINTWVHHVLIFIQYIGKETIDAFVNIYLSHKLSVATAEQQLVKYITLVRDIVFFDNDPPRTDTDKLERRDNTLAQLLLFVPENVKTVIGVDNHDHTLKIFFEMLQQPKLNKQLIYVLFDDIIQEVFPELKSEVGDGTS